MPSSSVSDGTSEHAQVSGERGPVGRGEAEPRTGRHPEKIPGPETQGAAGTVREHSAGSSILDRLATYLLYSCLAADVIM